MVSGDAAARARGIDIGRRWVDIAAALGSPSMRTNANYDTTLGGPDVFARVVEAYRALADYAQTVGIRLLVENIYGYTATIDHVIEVIKAVDSPNCRGIVDWGNSAAKTSEERVSECQRLMPYVDVVSAKGRAFDAQYRHTGWDIGALVRAAEAGGFRGIYSLDVDPGPQLDQTLATRSVIATIQANLAAG
jgi:sugar phosphate isomerase/epimerase